MSPLRLSSFACMWEVMEFRLKRRPSAKVEHSILADLISGPGALLRKGGHEQCGKPADDRDTYKHFKGNGERRETRLTDAGRIPEHKKEPKMMMGAINSVKARSTTLASKSRNAFVAQLNHDSYSRDTWTSTLQFRL